MSFSQHTLRSRKRTQSHTTGPSKPPAIARAEETSGIQSASVESDQPKAQGGQGKGQKATSFQAVSYILALTSCQRANQRLGLGECDRLGENRPETPRSTHMAPLLSTIMSHDASGGSRGLQEETNGLSVNDHWLSF